MIQFFPSQQNKKWILNFGNEFLGHIIKAFNLDLFSRKGFVKTGEKIYPHTTQSDISSLDIPKALCKANIDDGDLGGRENKLWAVAGDKVIKKQFDDTVCEYDEKNGFDNNEVIGENSDLISVGDETEEDIEPVTYSVSASSEYTFAIIGDNSATKNSATKWAQSFTKINGLLSKITIDLKKSGSPTDDILVSIESDSGGVPSGTALFQKTISYLDLTTSFVEQEIEIGADLQLELNKTYWIALERSGSGDILNYYCARLVVGDTYENGELKNYDKNGGWQGATKYAKTELFMSSGNFTVPAGVTEAIVEAWGAGGGGASAAGGGGGSAYARSLVTGLTPSSIIAVVIGNGGTGGVTGSDGGDTTFDTTVVVAAGGLGQTNGGLGGSTASSSGDVLYAGGNGEQGTGDQGGGGSAGDRGAASTIGAGNRNGINQNRCPGGGGSSTDGGAYAGGKGLLKVTYFVSPTDEFPYTAGRSWKRNDTAGTSHSITLPEDVIAGELLILVFGASQNAADITITTPTGWTQLIHEHQIKASLGVYYKRATDADTFTVTTSGNCSSSHIVLRVKNAGTPTGTSTTGTSGNINPPDHDPGESAEYLWLACGVLGVDSQETYEISVAPANYESFNWIKSLVSPETGDKSAITTVAERYLTASSENPGAFTNDSDEWCAATIAIPYEAETNEHDLKANLYFTFPMAYERLYITTSKDVRFLDEDNGTWQSLWQGILQQDELDEEYPAVLKSLGAGGTLILGNGDKIHTLVATANSVTEATANKLIFDYTLFVNWMVVTSSAVFIGLRHKESEYLPSMVVYYEPYSERTRIYQIEEGETVGFGMDDNCHIIDKKGQIRYFTGTSFKAYQWLPCYFRGENVTTLPHRNGIIVKQGIVKFLWEGQYPDPAGIWVLEEENLYHKHSLVFNKTTLNSLGAIDVGGLGALFEEDEIWLGASIIDGSEAEIKGLYSTAQEDSVSVADDQRTQIVTAKLFSPEINSVWQDLNLKYDPVSGGDFIVKQRKEASKVTEGSGATAYNGTWTANDTFTSSDADFISDIDASSIEIGDEIIVRKGQGAGLLAHITDISGSVGGTKTITIDEGLSAISSGTFTFSVENWEKMIFDSKDTKFSHRASLKDDKLEWKQFKIDIREHALEEIQIQSIIDKSLVRR